MKFKYDLVKEEMHVVKLDNGLELIIVPKPDYHKVYSLFATNYGSIDSEFVLDGERVKVPDGIAHFLEHKLFEKEDGDVFIKLSELGIDSNAYTSFDVTAYLAETTREMYQTALNVLLDFVQDPYFTDESVEREKGIIAQEIEMYNDDANWQTYFGLLRALYNNHPIATDVAGDVASINEITAADLHLCYNSFYHPSNMRLFVIGAVSVDDVVELVTNNQAHKTFPNPGAVGKLSPIGDVIEESLVEMQLNVGKFACGVRGFDLDALTPRELYVKQRTWSIAFEMLLGETSSVYSDLYARQLIDDSYSVEATRIRKDLYAAVLGDSNAAPEVLAVLKRAIQNSATSPDLNEAHLGTLKKAKIGAFLKRLNNLSSTIGAIAENNLDYFETIEIISAITLDSVRAELTNLAAGPIAVVEVK
ncbi:MAG: insulinase family protein [Lactobacillales bacterium]|jgi:predicted Zn-dependent peptidase|nr:insulinase family protein [Lactobacillales bacterium]